MPPKVTGLRRQWPRRVPAEASAHVGLLVPAVAPGACQDQVPHPVDRSTTNLGADRPGEDMVDLRLAVRRAIGGDRQVAIEAGALLVAVEGPLVSISAAGLPRSQAIDLCMAIR